MDQTSDQPLRISWVKLADLVFVEMPPRMVHQTLSIHIWSCAYELSRPLDVVFLGTKAFVLDEVLSLPIIIRNPAE